MEKELEVAHRGIKVLSFFFLDRVANYREYDQDGKPRPGRMAVAFEEELAALLKQDRYKTIGWAKHAVGRLHDGYFAQDPKGLMKDSKEGRDTSADNSAYELIMKDKERLLSQDEPLRFIFSHSALREGWDNPNVFQICTLNQAQSVVKKRQELGRGLRLPVDKDGRRVHDESINKLFVMANESYEDFAKALQKEYEEDCGVQFGKVTVKALSKITKLVDGVETPVGLTAAHAMRNALIEQKMLDDEGRILPAFAPEKPGFKLVLPQAFAPLTASVVDTLSSYQIERLIRREKNQGKSKLNHEVVLSPEFKQLWERIKHRTVFRVEFSTDELVERASKAIYTMPSVPKAEVLVTTGLLETKRGGVQTTALTAGRELVDLSNRPVPDMLAYLQNETELTRSTLVRIIAKSNRLQHFFQNPQYWLDAVAGILKHELHRLVVNGIQYEKLTGSDAAWEMVRFEHEEFVDYLTSLKVKKAAYDYLPYDSEVERALAEKLDQRQDIRLFVKLPAWFVVETPLGHYNPDWAIVKTNGQTLYLVRETKGTKDFLKLRTQEADKVNCGKKHFDALGVSFAVVTNADDI